MNQYPDHLLGQAASQDIAVTSGPSSPEPARSLTCRETEILERVALGLSAKEVARDLSIAPRTVERHIENIRMKLRARNTPHLVARAFFAGALRLSGSSIHALQG